MVDHHWDAIACDYVLTELGGFWSPDGRSITIHTGQKGLAQRRLTVQGVPGHGSMPYRSDNAIVRAAEVVRRIADHRPAAGFDALWESRVRASGLPADVQSALLNPSTLETTLESLPATEAAILHAGCHTTMSCNVIGGGQKVNTIPDAVTIEVDIRTLPGVSGADVDDLLGEILGDVGAFVRVEPIQDDDASASALDTPLWESLRRHVRNVFPASDLAPHLSVGADDGRQFRRKGAVSYGAGLFSPGIGLAAVASRFHGHNERIDVESLRLCTELWDHVVRDLLA